MFFSQAMEPNVGECHVFFFMCCFELSEDKYLGRFKILVLYLESEEMLFYERKKRALSGPMIKIAC